MSTLNDINGKESAKRKWANKMLWTTVAIVWVYTLIWGYTMIREIATPEIPEALLEMWYGLGGGGLTALGLTLGERINSGVKK